MWVRDGSAYFFGPIFIHPEETEHEPTKMFYKKEVFLSNLEEACPMTCIIGRVTRLGDDVDLQLYLFFYFLFLSIHNVLYIYIHSSNTVYIHSKQ